MAEQAFLRAVVIDVIHDPLIYKNTPEGASVLRTIYGDLSSRSIDDLPRNTVIARLARTELNPHASPEYQVFFPFFSSHLCLPVKPTEHVWVMFENPGTTGNITKRRTGFWISRIHESRRAEDVNIVNNEARLQPPPNTLKKTAAEKANVKASARERFIAQKDFPEDTHIGNPDFDNSGALEDTSTSQAASYIIEQQSIASAIHKKQAVPRFTKAPGDLVIQGSNNTLISLGQSRDNAFLVQNQLGSTANSGGTNLSAPSGEIDIVVGRGRSVATSANIDATYSTSTATNKSLNEEPSGEGDPDYREDAARILISSQRDPDELLEIDIGSDTPRLSEQIESILASNPTRDRSTANSVTRDTPTVAAKADSIRLVARQDIKIVMQTDDPEDACGITLTRDGDVIIIPGKDGFIKLGGSDADRALLCTRIPAKTKVNSKTNVIETIETPIFISGNALVSNISKSAAKEQENEDQAAFATRILVKGHG